MRLPLLHMGAARRGERGEAEQALAELAARLRNNPTPDECEQAAGILDRLAITGEKKHSTAWPDAGLKPSRRPPETARHVAVYQAVEARIDSGDTIPQARQRVARQEALSVSTVKRIHNETARAIHPDQ